MDTKKILDTLSDARDTYVVLLDEKWKSLSTSWIYELIQKQQNAAKKIIFIIGWPYGIDREILFPHVDAIYKLGDLILPHGLALMVLLEQIYRSWEIQKGTKYHHE